MQKYLFIPLDIFKIIRQNNGIRNEQDAWLTFLSSDDLDDIIYLIEYYPKFKPMYQEIYNLCQNMEKIMSLFSEELRILDQNTVKFMMDEMNEELENLKNQKTTLQNENADLQRQCSELLKQINSMKNSSS